MEVPAQLHPSQTTMLNHHERLLILGEIPLRKTDASGSPIFDQAGDPDTSFAAKIRADEPFTFQLINKEGKALTTSTTWHHVRPGEVKVDCRGCHAHTKPGLKFELTMASKPEYEIRDFTAVKPKRINFRVDVLPILVRHGCVGCHERGEGPRIDWRNGSKETGNIYLVYRSRLSEIIQRVESEDSTIRMPRDGDGLSDSEIRTLAEWIDTGMLDHDPAEGKDETKPTLFVHSPRRHTSPLTKVVVSAADAELDKDSLSVTLNGAPVTLIEDRNIWSAIVPETESGELVARVKDRFGNETKLVRSFGLSDATMPDYGPGPAPESVPISPPNPKPNPKPDPRDAIIAEQAARIRELEAKIERVINALK